MDKVILGVIIATIFIVLTFIICLKWSKFIAFFSKRYSKLVKVIKILHYKLKRFYLLHRQIILYALFGAGTVVINILVKNFFQYIVFNEKHPFISAEIGWFFAVLFAFITSKQFVFESFFNSAKNIVFEVVTFFIARLVTLLLDLGIIYLLNYVFGWDYVIVSIISLIFQIVINFLFSKFITFSKYVKLKLNLINLDDAIEYEHRYDGKVVYTNDTIYLSHQTRLQRKAIKNKKDYDKIIKEYASQPLNFDEFI